MFERIIVGVNEHGGGGNAIALARKLLARGGELTLAHVRAHDGHGYRGARAACEASGWERAAELLEKARAARWRLRVPEVVRLRLGGVEAHAACGREPAVALKE